MSRDEAARRKSEEERVAAENERIDAEEVRQTQEGAGGTEVSRVDAESDRDDAEIERARAALSRREAEKERVVAETDRVAEEDKRRSVRFFYAKLAGVLALPLAFVALLPAVIGIYLVNAESKKRSTENRQLIEQNEMFLSDGIDAKQALCSIRVREASVLVTEDAAIARAEQFLRDNPQGIPGVPNALILQGLKDRKATQETRRAELRILARIDCP